MSDSGLPFDHWASARSAMQKFERSAVPFSRTGLAGAGALAVSVALLIALGVLLNINLAQSRANFAWTHHADAILLHVVGIQESLFKAESSTRAFALTEDRAYLGTLHAADTEMALHRKTLYTLVSDNAQQTGRLDRLFSLLNAKLARFNWFAGLTREARRAQIASTGSAGAAMRSLQRRISSEIIVRLAEFRATELALLQQRRALAEGDAATMNLLVLVLAVVAPLCGFAGFILLFREHHQRRARELQLELIHTQRLALMGETASMLAHEVNQPLAAATNYLSALSRMIANRDLARPEKIAEATHKAAEQIARAVGIVQRLRNFITKRDSERAVEPPALLVSDAVALFASFGSTVPLRTQVAPNLPGLNIDRVQIQQVLVNLMRNALEAMQNSARRELDLEVKTGPGGMLLFCLRDTGPGLPKEVSERLFRPFVSTKTDGMGVGLSICQKIVSDHGGRIWAEAAAGGGAVFCFTLPSVVEEARSEAA